MGRYIRVKKAVEPKRLDKKKRGKEERAVAHKERLDVIMKDKTE